MWPKAVESLYVSIFGPRLHCDPDVLQFTPIKGFALPPQLER